MINNYIFALETQGSGGSLWMTLGLLAVMIVVMYFVAIKPSRKQEQEVKKMRDSLQVGDEITTIGGIIGRVVSIKDETCVIETSRNCTRIRILKSAVKSIDVPVEATKAPASAETDTADDKKKNKK